MAIYQIVQGDGRGESDCLSCPVTVNCNGRIYRTHCNPIHIMEYIPGLGAIIGIARLLFGLCFCFTAWGQCQMLRGTLDMCSLGILYLPFDYGWLKIIKIA